MDLFLVTFVEFRVTLVDQFSVTFVEPILSKVCEINLQKRMQRLRGKKKIKSVCNFIGLKNNILNYEFKECKKRWVKLINGLIKNFPNVYQFCNGDVNKFVLLLRKSVYPNEYMDSWKRFDKTSLEKKIKNIKKLFTANCYLEDITDKDYTHAQRVFKKLKLKNIRIYHDFYFQSDTLLLADVFENFRNKCTEIYELDHARFLPAPGLA